MGVVLLLEALLARGAQVMAADGHDIVAAVGRGVVDGLVLAHEEEGDGGGDAAERAAVGAHIDVVPCARVGKTSLWRLPGEGGRVSLVVFDSRGCKEVRLLYLSDGLRHGDRTGAGTPTRLESIN